MNLMPIRELSPSLYLNRCGKLEKELKIIQVMIDFGAVITKQAGRRRRRRRKGAQTRIVTKVKSANYRSKFKQKEKVF